MNTNQINEEFISKIKAKAGDSSYKVLQEALSLNKEAIYRRLRGTVPFLYSEAVQVAKKLNILLDEMNGFNFDSYTFLSNPFNNEEKDKVFDIAFYPERLLENHEEEIGVLNFVTHDIPYEILGYYPYLSKLHYYKWIYENRGSRIISKYSEMEIPEELKVLSSKKLNLMHALHSIYIVSERMIENYIDYITFFIETGLLSTDDKDFIKNDLLNLLDEFEQLTIMGKFEKGEKIDFYVSSLNITNMFGYAELKNSRVSFIRMFSYNHIITTNEVIYDILKKTLNNMKSYTTLISGVGSVYRNSFFRKQHELVNNLL